MGYYTWYTLEILKDPDNQEDQFWEELDNITAAQDPLPSRPDIRHLFARQ